MREKMCFIKVINDELSDIDEQLLMILRNLKIWNGYDLNDNINDEFLDIPRVAIERLDKLCIRLERPLNYFNKHKKNNAVELENSEQLSNVLALYCISRDCICTIDNVLIEIEKSENRGLLYTEEKLIAAKYVIDELGEQVKSWYETEKSILQQASGSLIMSYQTNEDFLKLIKEANKGISETETIKLREQKKSEV